MFIITVPSHVTLLSLSFYCLKQLCESITPSNVSPLSLFLTCNFAKQTCKTTLQANKKIKLRNFAKSTSINCVS